MRWWNGCEWSNHYHPPGTTIPITSTAGTGVSTRTGSVSTPVSPLKDQMSRHPLSRVSRRTSRLFARDGLGFVASFLGLGVLLALIGLLLVFEYQTTTETTGHLWWKETVAIPLEKRLPYLRAGFFLFGLSLLCLIAAWSLFIQHRRGAETRAAAADAANVEYAQQEASRRWLATPQGHAHTAYQEGRPEYVATLRVEPPLYAETVRMIESVGWSLSDRTDHPRVRTTEVSPRPDGGHEVTRSAVRDATFRFVRPQR